MLNPIVRALDGKYEEMYLKIKKMLSFQVQDIMEDSTFDHSYDVLLPLWGQGDRQMRDE